MASDSKSEIQLNVKFAPGGEAWGHLDEIEHTDGVRRAEQLFPGESHPDLASIFVVYLGKEDAERTITSLRELPDIDYVEAPASRKLIQPRRGTKRSATPR